jgi:hypothetical protein
MAVPMYGTYSRPTNELIATAASKTKMMKPRLSIFNIAHHFGADGADALAVR